MSKTVKIEIYKMMVKPTVVYGSDTMAMTEMDMKDWVRGRGKY